MDQGGLCPDDTDQGHTCSQGGGKVTTKTGAVTLGLLKALVIVFHTKVARTIFFAGIVSEKRYLG